MNEELNNALVEILIKATKTAETAKEFVLGEIPEIAEQILNWHMLKSLLWFGFSLFLFSTLVFLLIRLLKEPKGEHKTSQEMWSIYLTSIFFLGFTGYLVIASTTWLQILIAPKLYLIEYAADLVK